MKILTLILIQFCVLGGMAQNADFFDNNYIDVTGRAELEVIPNEIYLGIQIKESDSKGKSTIEKQEREMVTVLQKLGVDVEKELTVNDMSSNFKRYVLKQDAIFSSKQYQLLVHDAAKLAGVFEGLEDIGISNIKIDKVDHSSIDEFRNEVKVNAIKAARAKAEMLTQAIGQKTGRALYVREIDNHYGAVPRTNMMMKVSSGLMLGDSEDLPDFQFEPIKLQYAVQVYFELK
jgi:uncharacterized protein YggE